MSKLPYSARIHYDETCTGELILVDEREVAPDISEEASLSLLSRMRAEALLFAKNRFALGEKIKLIECRLKSGMNAITTYTPTNSLHNRQFDNIIGIDPTPEKKPLFFNGVY